LNAEIPLTSSRLSLADRWDHFLARWGVRRMQHLVSPGLYRIGDPDESSSVFVTANYTLSFDSLRAALEGMDGYILVLNTFGINVWCAAGKGTFGTDELVRRIEAAALIEVVRHRRLILPQLGAAGVSAHEVKKRAHFKVEYGPVRAADLPAYMRNGRQATAEMRQVRFGLAERLVLIPVELVHTLLPMVAAAVIAGLLLSPLAAAAVVACVLGGAALFPILLPWLPTQQFSSKGFILGELIALVFSILSWRSTGEMALWQQAGTAVSYLLWMPPVTAYLALNFTGSTTFTSKSGVKREMFTYILVMAWTLGIGTLLVIGMRLSEFFW
jgi:hypothetical protein